MPARLTDEERRLRAVTERDLQRLVIDAARVAGWRVAHFHDSRRQVRPGVFVGDRDAVGFPDLVLVRPPELLVLELKRETGRATAPQQAWLDELSSSGVDARLVRPRDLPGLLDRLARRPG